MIFNKTPEEVIECANSFVKIGDHNFIEVFNNNERKFLRTPKSSAERIVDLIESAGGDPQLENYVYFLAELMVVCGIDILPYLSDCNFTALFSNVTFKNLNYTAKVNLKYINNRMFAESDLKSIEAPNTVVVLNGAFDSCKNLQNVYLPEVIELTAHAFEDCTELTEISLPNCTKINHTSFQFCEGLKSISLPKLEVKCIEDRQLFSGCHSIEHIVLSKKVLKYVQDYLESNVAFLWEMLTGQSSNDFLSDASKNIEFV